MKWSMSLFSVMSLAMLLAAQQPPPEPPQGPPGFQGGFKKDGFGKDGFGKGPMGGQSRKLVKEFDQDGDGRLNTKERAAARASVKDGKGGFGGFGGFGGPKGKKDFAGDKDFGGKKDFKGKDFGKEFGKGPGGKGFGKGGGEPGKPGPKVKPADVKAYSDAKLYDPTVLRTVFLDFENQDDWEAELADFYHTDVEVPATLTVDGKSYPNVGVHFRGASSYFGVPAGLKHSLNLSMDFADTKQKLYGYKTLNLLNSHDDPTFMHTTLFSAIARNYLPAPKANYVKVVINGESWGVYVNVQQFNKEFLAENYGASKGTRWKIKGSPGGGGSLNYLGENIEAYKRLYEMKSGDGDKEWKALVKLCKVLDTTPTDELVKALEPMLDIDEVLKFLALDIALVNDDGYWTRASDYSLFRDPKGKFHVVPHDMNESFMTGKGGPGMGKGGFGGPKDGPPFGPGGEGKGKGGPGGFPGFPGPGGGPGMFGKGGGVQLDPLVGMEDSRKPLRSKLLSVPSLRAKYLEYVRNVARDGLDWQKLGPLVKQNRELIEKEIELDTRKLTSLDAFQRLTGDTPRPGGGEGVPGGPGFGGPGGPGGGLSLRAFADQRRAYLLAYAEPAKKPRD